MRAIWKDTVLAESDTTIMVEGNHYFPPEALRQAYFQASIQHSTCPWKGRASYLDIVVDGAENPGAAWSYHEPMPAAEEIRDYVAFWHGVRIEAADESCISSEQVIPDAESAPERRTQHDHVYSSQ